MTYNFDEIIDRKGTNAIKTDRCKLLFGTEDVLPLWVADMDFRTPDFILDAIKKRLDHPILGYTGTGKDFYPLMQKWIAEHHQWDIKREWIGFLPGIVPGLAFAVQSLTQPGDEIIVQPPVYYPFFNVIKNNKRTLIYNELKEENGRFVMDTGDLEKKISNKTKMLILCNPHNPGGRVWTKSELAKMAEVCQKHDIIIVSDEIHADMVLPGNTRHTPFATVSEWAANHSVTFMAPTKVFNMPGLVSSGYIIPEPKLRERFASFLEASEMNSGNIFAYIGAMAAYEHGEAWRLEMLDYVQQNIEFVNNFVKANVPQVEAMIPEASFLVWLNCEKLGMSTEDLHKFFSLKAGLGLNKGTIFGPGGEYHLRLNVACSRKILEQAMQQLKTAVDKLQQA
ncbi:MAG: aminotransferase class [Bacteroidetes bacterium]|nr:aminotransferase class [Bacteroidota bacterium]